MFISDNIGSMNVTTTQFAGRGLYLTLVTRDGQPWDFVEGATLDEAKKNHAAMLVACAFYDMDIPVPLEASQLN